MAQTKKKRRRKHRGTQGGRIDRRPARGRPRNRAEAQARAKNRGKGKGKGGQRTLTPPTWGSAVRKGLLAGVIFFVLLALAFGRPMPQSAGLAAFMLAFYIPMAYYTDRFFYSRQIRKEEQERIERKAQRTTGAGASDGDGE